MATAHHNNQWEIIRWFHNDNTPGNFWRISRWDSERNIWVHHSKFIYNSEDSAMIDLEHIKCEETKSFFSSLVKNWLGK